MSRRRDVEGEVYSRLYGGPGDSVGEDPTPEPVIEEPPTARPARSTDLGALRDGLRERRLAAWARLRTAAIAPRGPGFDTGPGRGRDRGFAAGALLTALIALAAIGALAPDPGPKPPSQAGSPTEEARTVKRSEARVAGSDQATRAARPRDSGRARDEERRAKRRKRTAAGRAASSEAEASPSTPSADSGGVVCVADLGCFLAGPEAPAREELAVEQPDEIVVEGAEDEVGALDGGDVPAGDFEVYGVGP